MPVPHNHGWKKSFSLLSCNDKHTIPTSLVSPALEKISLSSSCSNDCQEGFCNVNFPFIQWRHVVVAGRGGWYILYLADLKILLFPDYSGFERAIRTALNILHCVEYYHMKESNDHSISTTNLVVIVKFTSHIIFNECGSGMQYGRWWAQRVELPLIWSRNLFHGSGGMISRLMCSGLLVHDLRSPVRTKVVVYALNGAALPLLLFAAKSFHPHLSKIRV